MFEFDKVFNELAFEIPDHVIRQIEKLRDAYHNDIELARLDEIRRAQDKAIKVNHRMTSQPLTATAEHYFESRIDTINRSRGNRQERALRRQLKAKP